MPPRRAASPARSPARRAPSPSRSPATARPKAASTAAALPGRSRDHPYVIGVPWWLDDPDPSERTSDWATGQARYAGIMLGYAALALLGLRYFPPAWTTSPADVAASALLSPAWLCGFRAAAALLVLLLVLHLVLGPPKTQSESRLDGSEIFLRVGGCWRLGGLTQCGWILVGCYFSLSSWLTRAVWLDPTAPAHEVRARVREG